MLALRAALGRLKPLDKAQLPFAHARCRMQIYLVLTCPSKYILRRLGRLAIATTREGIHGPGQATDVAANPHRQNVGV